MNLFCLFAEQTNQFNRNKVENRKLFALILEIDEN